MGCRPSRHALGKVGDSTWEYNRAFMHDGVEKRAKQKNKKSGRGRGRKHPTYNDFSSTSKTYYNDSECKSSKITVRLSTDGSTLEIETFDVDFAAYRAEVEDAEEGSGSGVGGGKSHEATNHVTTVNVHSAENKDANGKRRLHRCESAPELVSPNTEPVVWKTWTKVYNTESSDDKFTCVEGGSGVLGKEGANVCDLVRGGFAECVRVDMENTGRMARDYGAGNPGNGNHNETIATPEVEQICDIFLKKTITSQTSVDGYRSISAEQRPDFLQSESIRKEIRNNKTCACKINGDKTDSRILPETNARCLCPDDASYLQNASEESPTCSMCLMCKSRTTSGRGSNSNSRQGRRPSSCDTLTCLVLFGSPTGPHDNPCCTLCRTSAFHDHDDSPARSYKHRAMAYHDSPTESCKCKHRATAKNDSPMESCKCKHRADKVDSWRSCMHDRHESTLSSRGGIAETTTAHECTRAKKLSPRRHAASCVGGISHTCAHIKSNQHSTDIACTCSQPRRAPATSNSASTIVSHNNNAAIDRVHTQQPYQDITKPIASSRGRSGDINNLKLCSICASAYMRTCSQRNGFRVVTSPSQPIPVDTEQKGRPRSIELGNFRVSSNFPDDLNKSVTMATNDNKKRTSYCDYCGRRRDALDLTAKTSTTTHDDDEDDDDDDGRYSPPRHDWTTDDLEELYYDDCGEYMLDNGVLSTYNFDTFPGETSDGELNLKGADDDDTDGEYEYGYGYESSEDKENNDENEADDDDNEAVELQDPFDNIPTVTRAYDDYAAIFDDEVDNSSDEDNDSDDVYIDAVESSYV